MIAESVLTPIKPVLKAPVPAAIYLHVKARSVKTVVNVQKIALMGSVIAALCPDVN